MGASATAIQADVSKVADIERLFAKTVERYGRVDIVVANAGIEVVGTRSPTSLRRTTTACSA